MADHSMRQEVGAAAGNVTVETNEPELITGAFLTKVCNKLGSVYFQLGLLLEVESACIQRLENDHRGNTWRILYEVLVEWRKNSKNRSNVIVMLHELIRALTHLELMDVVELVRHEQLRIVREELKQSNEELETWKQKYEEDIQQFNEQIRVLEDKTQKPQEQVVRPKVMQFRRIGIDDVQQRDEAEVSSDETDDPQNTHKQFALAMNELRQTKEDIETYKHRYEDDVKHLKEQIRILKVEEQRKQEEEVSPGTVAKRTTISPRDELIIKLKQQEQTVKGETNEDKKRRALRVMRSLRDCKEPMMWREASSEFVSDGKLNLSGVITASTLPDLVCLLCSGEARHVTTLNIGGCFSSVSEYEKLDNVFGDINVVKNLCRGLAAMPQLTKLGLVACQLTDDGFIEVCETITKTCKEMTWFGCWGNDKLSSAIESQVKKTMKKLSGLKIFLYDCSISRDCCKRLHKKYGDRIYVEL